jgi:hypothetical protein
MPYYIYSSSRGVYAITNTVTQEVYLGSSDHIETRRLYHRSDLRRNVHTNKPLQAAWHQYGASAFVLEPLVILEWFTPYEDCRRHLYRCERAVIDIYHDKDILLYNSPKSHPRLANPPSITLGEIDMGKIALDARQQFESSQEYNIRVFGTEYKSLREPA